MKVHKLFTKIYTDKNLNKKIFKKIFIPADKAYLESLVIDSTDKKGKPVKKFNLETVSLDKKAVKKLNLIAKDIKKQKGRIKIVSIGISLIIVTALLLALTIFRNVIARVAITSALEGTFGAKCDIQDIDFNLLETRFQLDGLSVANRKSPMTNLFEVGQFELYFNLLELTRAKIVSENIVIAGVTWNTPRSVSGVLPPKKEKAYQKKKAKEGDGKPNPVMAALEKEVQKVQSGVSLDSGLTALQNQFDPVAYLEKEKAALLSPAIVEKIKNDVPALITKWEGQTGEAKNRLGQTIDEANRVSSIDIKKIDSIDELKNLITDLDSAQKNIKGQVGYAQNLSKEADADFKKTKQLALDAEKAIKADTARLKSLVDSVKGFNLDTGKGLVSLAFKTFAVNTLGTYYPYLERGLHALDGMQKSQQKKQEPTLKAKASQLDRLAGRTISFGADSLPSLVFRNIELMAYNTASNMQGEGTVQNLTNDADRLDKPVTAQLAFIHGNMKEEVRGTFDVRSGATIPVDSAFVASGYPLVIDSNGVSGIPSIKGLMAADGTLLVSNEREVRIQTKLLVNQATLETSSFKPDFLWKRYSNVLSSVTSIDLKLTILISKDGNFDIDITTDLDQIIYEALQKEIKQIVEDFKKELRKEAEAWISEQQKIYASEIKKATDTMDGAKKLYEQCKDYDKLIDAKKAEAEKRVKTLVAQELDKQLAPAREAAAKAKAEADAAKQAAEAEAEKKKAELDAAKKAADAEAARIQKEAEDAKAAAEAKAKAEAEEAAKKKAAESLKKTKLPF